MRAPRFYHWLRAHLSVPMYFWLPCPMCGKNFGGHERGGMLLTSWSSGQGVCPSCADAATRRNREWMAANPHPPISVR